MKTLDEKIAEVSPARRKKIEDRAAHLVAEEISLSANPPDKESFRGRSRASLAGQLKPSV